MVSTSFYCALHSQRTSKLPSANLISLCSLPNDNFQESFSSHYFYLYAVYFYILTKILGTLKDMMTHTYTFLVVYF